MMGFFDDAKFNLETMKNAVMDLERPQIEALGYQFQPLAQPFIDKRWTKRKYLWYWTDAPIHVRMTVHNIAEAEYRKQWEAIQDDGYLIGMLKKRVLDMLSDDTYTAEDIDRAKADIY